MKRTSGAAGARSRWAAASVLVAAAMLGAGPATAQPLPPKRPAAATSTGASEVQGTVLSLDKDDLIIDVGSAAGATENLTVELWRPIKIKHPVSGKILTDRFKIGQLQIGQVRTAMSLARPVGTLTRDAVPGDIVIFNRTGAVTAPAPATATAAASAVLVSDPYADPVAVPAPLDPDAKNVTEMFESLTGRDVPTRIAAYEAFLRANRGSRFFTVIFQEALAFKRLLNPSTPLGKDARALPFVVSAPAAVNAVPGRSVRVAVELSPDATGAVLQVRTKGETFFRPLPMAAAGQGYFAAVVPADRVVERDLEYFIEAVGVGGTVTVVGSPRTPETIDVEPLPAAKPPPGGLGSLSLLTDYANFNRLRNNDYAWQTEGTFGIRYGDRGIRAVRMGFGVYRGVSGTVQELDELQKKGREVGLTYGYVEGEFGLHKYFSLSARLAVGLLDDGIGGGGQLFARIGSDLKTNLVLGGEILGGVGLRSIIQLQLETFARFPILLRTEVTNQPAGTSPTPSQRGTGIAEGQSDIAGRGIVQVGFRVTPDFTVAVRGSFQGRNINHAGPGVGGSVGYTW